MKEKLLAVLAGENYHPVYPDELAKKLGRVDKKTLQLLISQLASEGVIFMTKKGKVARPSDLGYLTGIFSSSGKGFGFASEAGDRTDEVFIPAKYTKGAMQGDTVILERFEGSAGRLPEGRVLLVSRRAVTEFTGMLQLDGKNYFVIPDNKKLGDKPFAISKKFDVDCQAGDKVLVGITQYPSGQNIPQGQVLDCFGPAQKLEANYKSVLYQYGVRMEFPEDVLEQARTVPQTLPDNLTGRLDLREKIVLTIDGADAKDLDDAVSLERLPNGNWELGVHIADVSYYVREGTPLEKEAFLRGTSIYFTDKVIPMLPEELSNGICSLNPQVDRLTLSAFMEFNQGADMVSTRFAKSVIRSRANGIYEEINRIFDGSADQEISEKYRDCIPMLNDMRDLSKRMDAYRHVRGQLDFFIPEAKVLLDENGDPVDVVPRERGISHRLIETFMLAANEAVAKFVHDKDKPCVYRVHEDPSTDKIENFRRVACALGYNVQTDQLDSRSLQKLLEQVRGTPHDRIISTLMLRSMMKARYSPACTGHFGLAAPYYCHFTSPIRRYPDLMVHRILSWMLEGKMNERLTRTMVGVTARAAEQSSQAEVTAVEAEREIEDLYKTLYMAPKVGESFEGIISSVTGFGFFVELPNTIEGLVHITALADDYYDFDEDRLILRGTRSGTTFSIGQPVQVKLVRADIISRQLDFTLSEKDEASQDG